LLPLNSTFSNSTLLKPCLVTKCLVVVPPEPLSGAVPVSDSALLIRWKMRLVRVQLQITRDVAVSVRGEWMPLCKHRVSAFSDMSPVFETVHQSLRCGRAALEQLLG